MASAKEVPSVPTHRFAKFNPFRDDDDEGGDDLGQDMNENSTAGGGHAIGGKADQEARKKLRVSHVLRTFLAHVNEIPKDAIGGDDSETQHSPAVQEILARPQVHHPSYVNDRSFALSEYFISSSHNTYLVGKQLYGSASAGSYTSHLGAGARCVEIDAWDNPDDKQEPKVTHGFTLTEHVPFRKVVEAIKATLDKEIAEEQPSPLPIFISLENHCSAQGQERLAAIFKDVLGDRLVTEQVKKADGKPASLGDLAGKVLVMVEYYGLEKQSAPGADDIEAKENRKVEGGGGGGDDETDKTEAKPIKIIPELASLGVYAQSMKPKDDAWLNGTLTEPQNHLVNVEERAVGELIEKGQGAAVAKHNSQHLMRIYPKGTRINSKNLNPVPFWGVGAQVCALNWQTFDASMQLNEALFAATDGYVLKPPHLRIGGKPPAPAKKTSLKLTIAGATDLAVPKGRDKDIKPYVSCTLYYPEQDGKPAKEKTSHYRIHKHKMLFGREQPPVTSPVWDPPEELTWSYDDANDDLSFLRILVKSDDAFSRNPAFLTSAIRLCSAPKGWHFVRLLDLRGAETQATLLLNISRESI